MYIWREIVTVPLLLRIHVPTQGLFSFCGVFFEYTRALGAAREAHKLRELGGSFFLQKHVCSMSAIVLLSQ